MLRPFFFNVTIEFNGKNLIASLGQPNFTARQPNVGQLRLPTVNEFLLEDAVFVKNAVAHTVVALSCKTVKIASGKSNLLMNVTSGYHYHTVFADSVQLLDVIQEKLWEKGFLASLQEHEPVEFN